MNTEMGGHRKVMTEVQRVLSVQPLFDQACIITNLSRTFVPPYPAAKAEEMFPQRIPIKWNCQTNALSKLQDFINRPLGTKEFRYAEPLRRLVKERLAEDGTPAISFRFFSQQKTSLFSDPLRTEVILALMVFELERLPAHLAFHNTYANTDFVEDCAPKKLVTALTNLAYRDRARNRDQQSTLCEDVRGLLRQLPLQLLYESMQSGKKKYHYADVVIHELAYHRRLQESEPAITIFQNGLCSQICRTIDSKYFKKEPDPAAVVIRALLLIADKFGNEYDLETVDGILAYTIECLEPFNPVVFQVIKNQWHASLQAAHLSRRLAYINQQYPRLIHAVSQA